MENSTILDTGNFRNPTAAERSALLQLRFEQETADLQVSRGAISLYVLGGIQLLYAAFLYYSTQEPYTSGALLFFSALFIGAGVLTRRYPFAVFFSTLVIYMLLIIIGAVSEPGMIYKGILLKIIILVILVKGLQAGIRLRSIKAQAAALGRTPADLRTME